MKITQKLFASLVFITAIGTFTGCSNNAADETSYCDPLIRVDVDRSRTETTDIDCTITDLLTKEYDQDVGGVGYGYGYSPTTGNFGVVVGDFNDKGVKHIVEYYVTAKDNEGVVCRFQIDELDWKGFEIGDPITVQIVYEYTKSGTPFKPYYAFNGNKITSMQFINTESDAGFSENSNQIDEN